MTALRDSDKPRSGGRARAALVPALFYVALAVAATLIGAALLGFFAHGMHTPVSYSGDSLLTSASMKGIIDNGQPFTNPHLAAPGTSTLFDFPGAESFFLVEIWLLSLFTSDYAVLFNLFVLLSYPLIALSAGWSMRRLGVARSSAFVFALLYAVLPFHQSRVLFHQSLATYYVVPLAVALVITVVFRTAKAEEGRSVKALLRQPLWVWLAVLAIGASGIYYAYFAMALAIVAAVLAAWSSRDAWKLAPAALVIAGIFLVIFAQLIPNFVYWQQEGRNNLASARVPAESDLFALRLTQLVFPVTGHRVARLAQFKDVYMHSYADLMGPVFNSIAYDSSLGFIGAFGLFLLLFWAFSASFRRPPPFGDDVPAKLSALGLTCLLLATVGGVGELVAYLGFASIRAYDRITPFIGFMSLAAVALLADAVMQRWRAQPAWPLSPRAGAAAVFLALVLAVGLFDQTTPATMPKYAEIEASFSSDRAFVQQIERDLPDGAMVFELPYVPFPESAPVGNTGAYDPLRMYLHSDTLHWSAGAFKGREDATWQESVSAMGVPEMVREVRDAGFDGIVVDRAGFEDADGLEAQLRQETGDGGLPSADGRFAFYRLAE